MTMAASSDDQRKWCWVTLVTKPSYVPGVIILAHTLNQQNSKYPLVVQYTDSLGDQAIAAMREEATNHGRLHLERVTLLLPRKDQENTGIVAERFKDTFTKLRAFEVYKLGYDRAVFLDADMAIFKNPDDLFESHLPGIDWLGANHACVCNLDHDSWAPPEWHKGNCPYTPLNGPDEVAHKDANSRPTYHLLNGGMLLFYPTESLWNGMLEYFNTSERLKDYQFPDQDFLADFYRNKWQPLSWKYNAIKTMRYWHPRMWSDEKLVVLHYIVDKPWERQVSKDGIAGHLGRDGDTHTWWWDIFIQWKVKRTKAGNSSKVLQLMEELVDTKEPYTEKTPLPQEVGKPEDVQPYP
jgi:inositol 3-alpha-galactosyltransferase